MERQQLITYIDNSLQFLWGIVFLLFPFFISTSTSDNYLLPKEVALGIVALLSLILFGIKFVINKKIQFRQTVLDFPILVFLSALIISAIFAVDRNDSLIAVVPYIFAAITYYILVNLIKKAETAFYFISSLITGAALLSVFSAFTYFKVYLILLPLTHTPSFTPLGSLLMQAIYLFAMLPLAIYFGFPLLRGKSNTKTFVFSLTSVILILGFALTLFQLVTSQKPLLLPFPTGFQIAFATISQDSQRLAQSFFFGSGIGTFLNDFTRFKPVSFNAYQDLWFYTFSNSSSFVLELLATTGILGLLSYLFIVGRTVINPAKNRSNPLYLSLILLIVASFIFAFSFPIIALLFIMLALFSSIATFKDPQSAFELEVSLVTLKKGIFSEDAHPIEHKSPVMPILLLLVFLVITTILTYFSATYVLSDVIFQDSLVAASNNNGQLTYQKQIQAINLFPYRSDYYRVFSQTNIALANSLLSLSTAKGSSPSSQIQQTILNLIQQSITVSKAATTLAPQSTVNWQNLSSVYRSLIGVGQNADSFTVAAAQQAIILDPSNPQEYTTLGGIYYQLQQWDNAIREFQLAVGVKQDYPNAYYNLGHAYEQKGDLQNALANYQIVQSLVANNANNRKTITSEITALEARIASQGKTPTTNNDKTRTVTPPVNQEPLSVSQPTQQLQPQVSPIPLVSQAPTK